MFLTLSCFYGLDGLWGGATSISDGIFVVAGATDTNVRRSTGVTTANSTNIRNTNQLNWAINYVIT